MAFKPYFWALIALCFIFWGLFIKFLGFVLAISLAGLIVFALYVWFSIDTKKAGY